MCQRYHISLPIQPQQQVRDVISGNDTGAAAESSIEKADRGKCRSNRDFRNHLRPQRCGGFVWVLPADNS